MSDTLPPADSDTAPSAAEVVAPQQQLAPLSIQATSLVRSIDALSNIFWISLGGTFLTIFFAGLNQLEGNANSDYISLGEYQVPKAILPLAAVTFAMFAFWMTANRLNMLAYVLGTTQLPRSMVHELFHLNPPILHVFDRDNVNRWSPFTGLSVLLVNWAIFFGNSAAITLEGVFQQLATAGSTDFFLLVAYAALLVIVVVYGSRNIIPPLKAILARLHNVEVELGWQRLTMGVVVFLIVIIVNEWDQLSSPGEQANDLLGPTFANAIDGETLFMNGVEVNLFGIDAVETDQTCQNAEGADYPCGRQATLALQRLVQDREVVCFPFIALDDRRIVGVCEIVTDTAVTPTKPQDFITREYRENDISRLMIELGHALSVGVGRTRYAEEQRQAQTERVGIWQGSFQPPASWRAKQ